MTYRRLCGDPFLKRRPRTTQFASLSKFKRKFKFKLPTWFPRLLPKPCRAEREWLVELLVPDAVLVVAAALPAVAVDRDVACRDSFVAAAANL